MQRRKILVVVVVVVCMAEGVGEGSIQRAVIYIYWYFGILRAVIYDREKYTK